MGASPSTFIYTEDGIFVKTYTDDNDDGLDVHKCYTVKWRLPGGIHLEDIGVMKCVRNRWLTYSYMYAIGTLVSRNRLCITRRFLRIEDVLDRIATLGKLHTTTTLYIMQRGKRRGKNRRFSTFEWDSVSRLEYDSDQHKWITISDPRHKFKSIDYGLVQSLIA
jgi:hypothetical protein